MGGGDFTESIFICCGCALLSKYLAWFLTIWTLTTASHMQVTSAESHLGHWNKVTDRWLCSMYRGATWLTASVSGKKEERAVVQTMTKDSNYTGFCYSHGDSVKSHLDKPTCFFGLQLPSLEAYSSIASEGDLEQDPNLNGLNCLLKVTLP